jgi:DNA-binding PadR family transcriptional regulator
LAHLDADTPGLDVARVIESRMAREISPGAIYTGLGRLEKKRLVASRLGEPTPQRGGNRRRLYRVTAAGMRALAQNHAAFGELTRGLKPKLQTP